MMNIGLVLDHDETHRTHVDFQLLGGCTPVSQ
jgi:hypothetical protein